jgi:uncharacterized OsmC-like protein
MRPTTENYLKNDASKLAGRKIPRSGDVAPPVARHLAVHGDPRPRIGARVRIEGVVMGRQKLFVVTNGRRDGFHATMRSGQLLELADPDSCHALAPTPDELLVGSIASDSAWSARRLLRARRLPDDVSVSAAWRTHEDPPRLADVDVTVTVSNSAEAVSAMLVAAVENSFAARSVNAPLRVRVRCD